MVSHKQVDFPVLFDHSPNPYVVVARDMTVIAANAAYLRATGVSRDSLIGHDIFDVFPGSPAGKEAALVRASLERVLTRRQPDTIPVLPYPVPGQAAEGEYEERYWSVVHTPILDQEGEVIQIVQSASDITRLTPAADRGSRRSGVQRPLVPVEHLSGTIVQRAQMTQEINEALKAEQNHLRQLFEQAPGFIAVLRGKDHVIELANDAYYQVIGHRDVIGKPSREALPEIAGQGFFELLDHVYATGTPYIGRAQPVRIQAYPGASYDLKHLDFVYQPIFDANGAVMGIFVQGHDVTEAHELARQIRHQAAHDTLTGLLNRREFERRLQAAIEVGVDEEMAHSLLYLDLDQFKLVNDTCGHAAGDELLRQVAERLQAYTRNVGTLGRIGGDEFALLLENCFVECARRFAETLREAIGDIEFTWGSRRFGGSVSIGVISFGGDGLSRQEVLKNADSACFVAKEQGRNRVHVYHPDDAEMTSRLREMNWVSRLRHALEESRLVLYAQDIVPLDERLRDPGRKEILLRLRETDGSVIPSMAFIPAAERYNLMPAVDRYVVNAAFRHFAGLSREERASHSYAINLSATTLNDEEFLPFVENELAVHGIEAERICFEITETAVIANLTWTARAIRALREMGFLIALDDFGRGMSSFTHLKHLPVDFIKIDGEFIKEGLVDPVDTAMVQAIVNVAHAMGIQTVAEYVGDRYVRSLLNALGVDYSQGFGIHAPEPLVCADKQAVASASGAASRVAERN